MGSGKANVKKGHEKRKQSDIAEEAVKVKMSPSEVIHRKQCKKKK